MAEILIRRYAKGLIILFHLFLIIIKGTSNYQSFTYLSGKLIGYFNVSRDSFHSTGRWIHPKRMGSTFFLEVATTPAQMPQEGLFLHETAITSQIASFGNPRMLS